MRWWNHKGPVDICVLSWAREGGESVDSENGVGGEGSDGLGCSSDGICKEALAGLAGRSRVEVTGVTGLALASACTMGIGVGGCGGVGCPAEAVVLFFVEAFLIPPSYSHRDGGYHY